MSRRIATAVALTAALLTLTAACGNDDPAPIPTSTASATSSKPATPKDQAIADATAALDRYFTTRSELERDPRLPLGPLKKVAISTGLINTETILKISRGKKQHVVGEAQWDVSKVLDASLDNSAPEKGIVPTVTFQVCYDVSKVDVLDSTGKSIVSSKRLDRALATYRVSNYTWAKNKREGWKVSSIDQPGNRSC